MQKPALPERLLHVLVWRTGTRLSECLGSEVIHAIPKPSGAITGNVLVVLLLEPGGTVSEEEINDILDASLYVAQVPTYAAGFMTLGWGCHSPEPRATSPASSTRQATFSA